MRNYFDYLQYLQDGGRFTGAELATKFSRDQIRGMQDFLKQNGWYSGTSDGLATRKDKKQSNTEKGLEQAYAAGYLIDDSGNFVKPKPQQQQSSSVNIMGTTGPIPTTGGAGFVPPAIQLSAKQEDKLKHSGDVAKSRFSHTLKFGPGTNTIVDLVGANVNRYILKPINDALGTNLKVPKRTNTEADVYPSDKIFLQEAARRVESDIPEFKNGRAKFFEEHPDAKITYHFVGNTSKDKYNTYPYDRSQSGYQKFFGTPYGGVMVYGVGKSMTTPNARMQNALGGFNITYTKDGIQITDDWNYHSGAGNKTSVGGIIKTAGESYGTHKQNGEPVVVTNDIRLPYLEDDRYKDVNFMDFSDIFIR